MNRLFIAVPGGITVCSPSSRRGIPGVINVWSACSRAVGLCRSLRRLLAVVHDD